MKTKLLIIGCCFAVASGAELELGKTTMEIYGHAMLDMGFQAGQNDPNWYDVVRPAKLPVYQDQYGADGNWFMGVRQSRLGFKTTTPLGDEEIKTIFEFELFGTGVDEGQTTFRLRHAYGEYKHFGAGQYWSVFMDPDVFPNSLEYWGPSGMIFYRNIQFRYMPVKGENNNVAISLEKPGASGDPGYESASFPNTTGRFPAPDLAAHYRHSQGWGHIQLAGILRYFEIEDTGGGNLDDEFVGWGLNLSGNYKIGNDTVRLQLVYGEGVGNYLNDGAPDIGATGPGSAETLPLLGIVAFYDHSWSDKLTSSVGYSMYNVDNSSAQTPSAFKTGHYALANVLHHPTPNLTYGLELQYGKRQNKGDGQMFDFDDDATTPDVLIESFDDIRIQFSVKFAFGATLGGDS
ncbi:DcaP family trimeric outer membrane transporter [Pontiellaceae bacterium B12227]|nr:DcaP family trimeric outer membrane transporter [Pontiellaceae bacterium B12227]